jgi:hypothetical protein
VGAARLLRFGGRLAAGFRFESPRGGAAGRERPSFGAELLPGLAELFLDLRSGEEAAEGAVGDVVVAGERPQRLAGGAAAKELRVGDESAQPRPALARERPRLRPLAGVIVERSRQDHRVDRAGSSLDRRQLGGSEQCLGAAACGDGLFGLFVVGAVPVAGELRCCSRSAAICSSARWRTSCSSRRSAA